MRQNVSFDSKGCRPLCWLSLALKSRGGSSACLSFVYSHKAAKKKKQQRRRKKKLKKVGKGREEEVAKKNNTDTLAVCNKQGYTTD